jgi:hypothetical protein
MRLYLVNKSIILKEREMNNKLEKAVKIITIRIEDVNPKTAKKQNQIWGGIIVVTAIMAMLSILINWNVNKESSFLVIYLIGTMSYFAMATGHYFVQFNNLPRSKYGRTQSMVWSISLAVIGVAVTWIPINFQLSF